MKTIIVLVLFVLQCYGFNKLPPYVKTCSKSDPDFKACGLKNGREAIPYIAEGDSTYLIPSLKPFKINYASLDAGENIKLFATNLSIFGLDQADLREFNWNFEEKIISMGLFLPCIIIQGTYNMKGRILIMNFDGSGFMNNSHYENDVKINIFYSLKTKGNKEYIYVDKVVTNITILKGVKLHFANLLNNADLSKRMNEFLNENWKILMVDMMSSLNRLFSDVAKSVANPIAEKIQFSDIITP